MALRIDTPGAAAQAVEQIQQLRTRMSRLQESTPAGSLGPLETHPALAGLVQLRAGAAYSVDSATLALALLAGPSRAGGLCAAVGVADFGVHWDGGVLDYHLDLDFGAGGGLVPYPPFYPPALPGWFDKAPRWRRARGDNCARALLVAPSDAFVASLPGGKIPDRRDFYTLAEGERMRRWRAVVDASERLGDELRELVETGRIADAVRPWRGRRPGRAFSPQRQRTQRTAR